MSTKSCINVVILALMFVFLVQSSIQQTPDNDNEQLCLSHDETWWQVTPRTGANLQVDIHMKLQAFSATNVNRGQVHLKVVEKKGPALGYTTPTVGVDLHGSYFIADNFTMSSLTCTVVLNNNYADDTTAICTKFKSMFASQTLKISFGDECEDLTLTGFTSFYKKALTFLPAVDPSTTCDLRGPHATGSYYWLSTNNRNYFGSQTKEDIFFVVEKDSKKFTLTQVVYLKESGVVDCNVNKLIATFKGDVTYNSQVSVLIANYTNCEIVQGLNNAECDLCSNGRNFFLNGPIHWTSNGTCDHWIYSSGAPDSGVDVLEASFAPTSLTPPTSETEITMFIIFAAIIFCILVFLIPFILIVIRDCRRYREEKLRGGHQQL